MRIEKMDKEKLRNTRDLGGLPAADGKKIKSGKLIRGGRISKIPPETLDFLQSLNIDNIIDMRTQKEIAEHRPTLIEGAEYHYLPFVFTASPDIVPTKLASSTVLYKERKRIKKEFADADEYMQKMYSYILFSPPSMARIREIFTLFAEEENCILFHCNSGKDRTGIIAMLLESVLGVPEDIIIEDYTISFHFMEKHRNRQLFWLKVAPISVRFKNILRAMIYAKPQYIIGAMDEIRQKYGSVENYLLNGVGVKKEQLSSIRAKYLE